MRNVHVAVLATVRADEAFDRISEFARYPELVDVVRSVTVYNVAPGEPIRSDWEVYFRNGILRWSEQDAIQREALRIDFEQLDGDFDEFTGSWQLRAIGSGCEVQFDAEFDFGIPSLAGIIDPIAERVLKDTIIRVLAGLFDEVFPLDDDEVVRTALTAAGHVVGAAVSPKGLHRWIT